MFSIGCIISYLLLRTSPSASDLPMTPHWFIAWLNTYHDLRTLPMAFGYAIIPALLQWDHKPKRRISLGIILLILILCETAQLMIPSRRFTWFDILYSVLGVLMAEGIARLIYKIRMPQITMSGLV